MFESIFVIVFRIVYDRLYDRIAVLKVLPKKINLNKVKFEKLMKTGLVSFHYKMKSDANIINFFKWDLSSNIKNESNTFTHA